MEKPPAKPIPDVLKSTLKIEKGDVLAGAVKNPDGSLDTSRAAILHASKEQIPTLDKEILTPDEKRSFLSVVSMQRSSEKARSIAWKAKEKSVTAEALLQEMRDYAKSRIQSPEKVHYYHRTSFKNFGHILESGSLLSRSEIKKRNPEVELPAWSSNDDVMMTKDSYDAEGKLLKRGLTPHGVGASGKGVTLVFDSRIHAVDNFDAIDLYPTISEASLQNICAAVLVDKQEDIVEVSSMLEEKGFQNTPVMLKSDWEKDNYSGEAAV
jgi:hypothetical protein